jgi:hypothetical protein
MGDPPHLRIQNCAAQYKRTSVCFITAMQFTEAQPIPSPPFYRKSLLLQTEDDDADAPRKPKIVLTRTAKNKMTTHDVKHDFAEYALNHGTYHESKVFSNHFHVRCLNHELIITINPTDIVVITYHHTFNEESANSQTCNNIYRSGIAQPDLSWIRGTKQQPRAKSVSPRNLLRNDRSAPRPIMRPSTTSPPPTTITQPLRRSPLAHCTYSYN